jgi:monoterpene epsilon-lactone hydrolase
MSGPLDRIAARIRENVRKKADGDIDVPAERATFESMGKICQPIADVAIETREIGGVRCEILTPKQHERRIVYFHGGAFCLGAPIGYRNWLTHVANAAHAELVVPDYRLAPEHPFPAATDDAFAVWRSANANVMMGDSAGANLTLATTVRARDEGAKLPESAVLISPWIDLEHTGETLKTNATQDPIVREGDSRAHAKLYFRDLSPRDPRVSPLYADLRNLPPIYVQVGRDEALFDDARRFEARAREAKVDVKVDVFEGVFHVWHFFAGVAPESDDAIARIAAFVNRRRSC